MKVLLDAMGTDLGPKEAVLGAAEAVKKYGIEVILCGDPEILEPLLAESGDSRLYVEPARDVITMEDDPTMAARRKGDASMIRGLKRLSEGAADAFVSGGNTGALAVAATMIVRRAEGVRRCALGAMVPGEGSPTLLCDAGANAEVTPEMLYQFAVMGSAYAASAMGRKNPKVGLLNIGTESNKGDTLRRGAFSLLQTAAKEGKLHFAGNIEGRDLAAGAVDVLVCDGFTGNAVLKTYEGLGAYMGRFMKDTFSRNLYRKLCVLPFYGDIRFLKKKLDYRETGGAPILGLRKPVIKAHGSSNARAFCAAIGQAVAAAENRAMELTL